jgi:hypothetical protein
VTVIPDPPGLSPLVSHAIQTFLLFSFFSTPFGLGYLIPAFWPRSSGGKFLLFSILFAVGSGYVRGAYSIRAWFDRTPNPHFVLLAMAAFWTMIGVFAGLQGRMHLRRGGTRWYLLKWSTALIAIALTGLLIEIPIHRLVLREPVPSEVSSMQLANLMVGLVLLLSTGPQSLRSGISIVSQELVAVFTLFGAINVAAELAYSQSVPDLLWWFSETSAPETYRFFAPFVLALALAFMNSEGLLVTRHR